MLELRASHNLKYLLLAAGLPRSTYYYHLKSAQKSDRYLDIKNTIKKIFDHHKGRYGYRRIVDALRVQGSHLNHKTVRRLMQALKLKCRVKVKKYRSYRGEVGLAAPNILERHFEAARPNEKWVTDVTEFNINGQKLYLSPVMDLFNGEIVAFETSLRPVFGMVETMLRKAFSKVSQPGLILHSDQGWQYRMPTYRNLLRQKEIVQSMSRKGNCLDNAPIESFFGILKSELYHIDRFDSVQHLQTEIEKYIKYYNNERIKMKLNGLSPVEYRKRQALS